jgi:hypothetical protein
MAPPTRKVEAFLSKGKAWATRLDHAIEFYENTVTSELAL